MKEKSVIGKIGGLTTTVLLATGLCLMMFSVISAEVFQWPIVFNAFIRDVGLLLSAVMAGTLLHEKLLRDEMLSDIVQKLEFKLKEHRKELHDEILNHVVLNLDKKLSEKVPAREEYAEYIAGRVHELFSDNPPALKGINLINDKRRNFVGYYTWIIEQKAQDLFFAGRSVLHRIDADIRLRTGRTTEEIIIRKLKEGSRIHILLLDPRMDIIDRLAIEEGSSPEKLLGDVAESIGICQRINNLLKIEFCKIPPNAELSIKVYDRIPYFAYHKQDDIVFIGFYFLTGLGCTSAAYEVLDDKTKYSFGDHFEQIFLQGKVIVEFDGGRGRPDFKEDLYNDIYKVLEEKLGKEILEERINKVTSISLVNG